MLGCGQIFSQGAKLVNESIENGKCIIPIHGGIYREIVLPWFCHAFIGLLSDGNVHSILHILNQ